MGVVKDLYESFWTALENGSFKGYARGCAVVNVFLLFAVPIICFISLKALPIVTSVLLLIFSVILGVLELPFCCLCFSFCKNLAYYVKFFEIYWIRAILYLGLGTCLISVAIHVESNNPATWYFGLILPIIAVLYLIASYTGEKSTLDAPPPASSNDGAASKPVERDAARSDAHHASVALDVGSVALQNKEAVRDAASNNHDLLRDALRAAAGSRV
mmetsp:Transcript_64613/g.173143  ORF Transcript_64613/g.173143 Transcript_64613/m.173143 type:complete len:216 (+) Transcript_64613:77-724(+)